MTQNCQNYEEKGNVPDSPVAADHTVGDVAPYKLVPIAHSHLRLTVLPVLADESDDDGSTSAPWCCSGGVAPQGACAGLDQHDCEFHEPQCAWGPEGC